MRASIIRRLFYSLTFLFLSCASVDTYAEYYFVTEGMDTCYTCPTRTIYRYRHRHKYHHPIHHRCYGCNRYHISVHYYLPPCNCCGGGCDDEYAPTCGGCRTRYYHSCHSYYDVYPGSCNDPFMDSYYYYEYNRRIYFQDRATADDDTYYHPGMDIDN